MTTEKAFTMTKGLAVLADPRLKHIQRGSCKDIEQAHQESSRVYAHVFHILERICIAKDFERLDEPFQLGILLHEFGHIAMASDLEDDADKWVREKLGIPLEYRNTIQWVSMDELLEAYRKQANGSDSKLDT